MSEQMQPAQFPVIRRSAVERPRYPAVFRGVNFGKYSIPSAGLATGQHWEGRLSTAAINAKKEPNRRCLI